MQIIAKEHLVQACAVEKSCFALNSISVHVSEENGCFPFLH